MIFILLSPLANNLVEGGALKAWSARLDLKCYSDELWARSDTFT